MSGSGGSIGAGGGSSDYASYLYGNANISAPPKHMLMQQHAQGAGGGAGAGLGAAGSSVLYQGANSNLERSGGGGTVLPLLVPQGGGGSGGGGGGAGAKSDGVSKKGKKKKKGGGGAGVKVNGLLMGLAAGGLATRRGK